MRTRNAFVVIVVLGGLTACNGAAAPLRQRFEARHVTAELRADVASAAEASHRAVMAETDDASADAAREAEGATARVAAKTERLDALLRSLGYRHEGSELQAFNQAFASYRDLDREILSLAVENTNLKAQRLLDGQASAAVDALRAALEEAGRLAPPRSRASADAFVARILAAALEIEVIEGRHIRAADDSAMTSMEARMTTLQDGADESLRELHAGLPRAAAAHVSDAAAALERFESVRADLVALSRRNTNVRSLALVLGKQRTLAADCESRLSALANELEGHEQEGTR